VRHVVMLPTLCLVTQLSFAQDRPPVPQTLALEHVTVIDVTGKPSGSDQTVVIAGDHIARMGPSQKIPAPKNARVVNGSGLYLIPGLWDMHVHICETERAFPMFTANGVTGVRNMGGHLDELKRWREQTGGRALLGPRMVICGPVVDGPNPAHAWEYRPAYLPDPLSMHISEAGIEEPMWIHLI
jgi:hypothetical protein